MTRCVAVIRANTKGIGVVGITEATTPMQAVSESKYFNPKLGLRIQNIAQLIASQNKRYAQYGPATQAVPQFKLGMLIPIDHG